MPEILVKVRNKIAEAVGKPVIICGNSDYTVRFLTDAEWTGYPLKTARIVFQAGDRMLYHDVLFAGDTAEIPALDRTHLALIGLFAGDIRTTSPARITCVASVCGGRIPEPPPDLAHQLLRALSEIKQPGASDAEPCADTVQAGTVIRAEWEE